MTPQVLKRHIADEVLESVRRSAKLLPVARTEVVSTDSPLAVVLKVWPFRDGAPRYFEVRLRELL